MASYLSKGGKKQSFDRNNLKLEDSDCYLVSQSSSSLVAAEEIDTRMEGDDGSIEHNQPTCSSMMDSSNGSGSILHGSSSSSRCFEEGKHSKVKESSVDSRSKITVQATCKEDTI